MASATAYLKTFFAERALDVRTFEKTAPGGTVNFIDSDSVIEHILTTRGQEAEQIAAIVRRIDVANGNLHHFLDHLAGALAFDI